MAVTFPYDLIEVRKTLVAEILRVTELTAIVENPQVQQAPRPALPYFSFNITSPGIKSGDDSKQYAQTSPTTIDVTVGGVRKMMVSFHCYASTNEIAWQYMALWQSGLEQITTQENLRGVGIAVWLIGNVADFTSLLNTGYEGRAQMDVSFGIAANLTETIAPIDKVGLTGTINGDEQNQFDVPET